MKRVISRCYFGWSRCAKSRQELTVLLSFLTVSLDSRSPRTSTVGVITISIFWRRRSSSSCVSVSMPAATEPLCASQRSMLWAPFSVTTLLAVASTPRDDRIVRLAVHRKLDPPLDMRSPSGSGGAWPPQDPIPLHSELQVGTHAVQRPCYRRANAAQAGMYRDSRPPSLIHHQLG